MFRTVLLLFLCAVGSLPAAFYEEGQIGSVHYTFTDSSIVVRTVNCPDSNVKNVLLSHPHPENVLTVYLGVPNVDLDVLLGVCQRQFFPNQVLYCFDSSAIDNCVYIQSSYHTEDQMLDLLHQLPNLSNVRILNISLPHMSIKTLTTIGQVCPYLRNASLQGLYVDNYELANADFYFPNLLVLDLFLEGPEPLSWGMKNLAQHMPVIHFMGIKKGCVMDEALTSILECCPKLRNLILADSTLLTDFAIESLANSRQDFNFLSLHGGGFSWDKLAQLISSQSKGCYFVFSILNSKVPYSHGEVLAFMANNGIRGEFSWSYNNVYYSAPVYVPRFGD